MSEIALRGSQTRRVSSLSMKNAHRMPLSFAIQPRNKSQLDPKPVWLSYFVFDPHGIHGTIQDNPVNIVSHHSPNEKRAALRLCFGTLSAKTPGILPRRATCRYRVRLISDELVVLAAGESIDRLFPAPFACSMLLCCRQQYSETRTVVFARVKLRSCLKRADHEPRLWITSKTSHQRDRLRNTRWCRP